MATSTKKRKKRMKRQLQKRFKQTSGTVLVSTEPEKEFKAHLLYEGKYIKENEQYQQQLDAVYGSGMVTPIERFVNQKSILVHHCSKCSNKFYGKPLWLVNGFQPHDCKSIGGGAFKKNHAKKAKKKDHKIGNSNEKNGVGLVKKLDELIQQGLNPRQIRAKTGVDIQIIAYYKETFHENKAAGLG
jgi:hypothetical protein